MHRGIASRIPYHFLETGAGSALRRKCLYGRCGVFAAQCLEPGPLSSPSSQGGVPPLPAPCGSCPAYDPHFRGLLLPCSLRGSGQSGLETAPLQLHFYGPISSRTEPCASLPLPFCSQDLHRSCSWTSRSLVSIPRHWPCWPSCSSRLRPDRIVLAPQSAALLDFFTPEDVVIVTRHEGARVFSLLSPQCGRVCGLTQRLHELWRRNVLCRRTCDGEGLFPSYRAASFVPVFHAQASPCTKRHPLCSHLYAPRRSHPW